jgi:hypothetical protein
MQVLRRTLRSARAWALLITICSMLLAVSAQRAEAWCGPCPDGTCPRPGGGCSGVGGTYCQDAGIYGWRLMECVDNPSCPTCCPTWVMTEALCG